VILSTAYLGNVQYYTKLLSGRAQIDLHEHYQKQSCRNRCDILSTGGPTTLVVPVCRPSGERVPVVPNLSIVDLLFCEGPSAAGVLAASVPSAGVHPSLAR